MAVFLLDLIITPTRKITEPLQMQIGARILQAWRICVLNSLRRQRYPGRHVGDLGNITANASGVASGKIEDALIKLEGQFSVIGR